MKNNKSLRYIAYIRKSEVREDWQILSHEAQEREIKERFSDLNIVRWEFESKSAFKPGREKFGSVLDDITAGRADGIIA